MTVQSGIPVVRRWYFQRDPTPRIPQEFLMLEPHYMYGSDNPLRMWVQEVPYGDHLMLNCMYLEDANCLYLLEITFFMGDAAQFVLPKWFALAGAMEVSDDLRFEYSQLIRDGFSKFSRSIPVICKTCGGMMRPHTSGWECCNSDCEEVELFPDL